MRGGGGVLSTLSELLEALSYDESLKISGVSCQIIIDDDGIDENNTRNDPASIEVVRLFQQLVYLNLKLDIKKKSELRKSQIKDRFRAMHKELQAEAQNRITALQSAASDLKIGDEGSERVQKIIDSLSEMQKAFDEGKARTLKIAAMGTKKAGKSVIINSILGRDYAPTSSELPTPNVVRYIPCGEDTPLTLEYRGTTQTFRTPEEISSYILGEFKAAQKNTGEGSELEDMTIYYPSDEYTGYEVIDTPGPNFAGAGTKHYEIARKCIQEADICIFVMNYSNHLTTDEQKFLQEIRTVFAEQGKFYSLFVAVNRSDERYASEVEKSVCRLVDYIRSRLEGLGYRNVILFGTSALQSFYLDKTSDFMKELDICPQNNEPLMPELETLFDDHPKQAKKHTTELAFVETALRNLKRFHGVKKPTASDLQIFSGIPQLEQHLKYIGESKVDNEIVYNVIMRCEGYFSAIRNALLVTRLLELSEQDKDALTELDKLMGDFTRRVQEIIASLQRAADSGVRNTVLLELARASESNRDEILGLVEDTCRLTVRNIPITDEDLSSARQGNITYSLRAINSAVREAIADLSVRYTKAVIATSESVNSYHSKEVERLLREAREKVLEEFGRVKSRLNNEAALSLINEFRIPEFPPSLNKLDFTAGSFDASGIDEQFLMSAAESSCTRVSEIKYRKESRRERRSARSFWEKVKAFFGAEYYEYRDVQVPYEEFRDVYDADRFRRTVAAILEKNVRRSVVNVIKEVNKAAEHDAEEIFSDISRQCEEINAQYMENFRTLSNDIQTAIDTTGKHRLSLLADIDALKKIADELAGFFRMWDEVLGGGR